MAIDLAVASGGPTYQRLKRHLPAHGIAVHHVDTGPGITSLTEGIPPFPSYDVGFIYPARIVNGDVVTAIHELQWVNSRANILTTRNKAGSLTKLSMAGVEIPPTIHLSSPIEWPELRSAFHRLEPPVVIKPNTATKGIGIVRVTDEDSLRGVFDYLDLIHSFSATGDRSFLLQSYVPEALDLRLTVIDGTVAGAVERRFHDPGSGRWVRNVHRGASTLSITPPAPVVEVAEAAASVLGVPLLGVDILMTDEQPIVLEVNGRPTIDTVEKYPADFYEQLASLIETTASD